MRIKVKLSILLLFPIALLGNVILDDFESYNNNDDLPTVTSSYWTKDTGVVAVISNEQNQTPSGSKSVKLTASATPTWIKRTLQPSEWGSETIAYVDFAILPIADDSATPLNNINADSSILGFIKDGSVGRLQLIDGNGQGTGAAQSTDFTFSIGANNEALDWILLTIRQDFTSKTFDVYLNDRLYAVNKGFDGVQSLPDEFYLYQDKSERAYLDDFQIVSLNPMSFTDTDNDGLPDSFEDANSLNSNNIADRDTDYDGDGLTNIEEYLVGSLPNIAGMDGEANLYINNAVSVGNDTHDGLAAWPMGGSRGPKSTVQAAINTSQNNDKIIILAGNLLGYDESQSLNLTGKNLVLKPIGNIIIK